MSNYDQRHSQSGPTYGQPSENQPPSGYGQPSGNQPPSGYGQPSGYAQQPAGYGGPYGSPYGPAPKKRGMKRIVAGIIGIVLNGIGLFLMPIVLGFVGLIISAVGMMSLTSIEPEGGSFSVSGTTVTTVFVPADEAGASCEFVSDPPVDVSPDTSQLTVEHDGTTYIAAYEVMATSSQEVEVLCPGVSDVAVSEINVLWTLAGGGVGILIPVVLGFASLVVLVWGIIARMRS